MTGRPLLFSTHKAYKRLLAFLRARVTHHKLLGVYIYIYIYIVTKPGIRILGTFALPDKLSVGIGAS